MAIMCILSIASTAGTMGVITWNLYEHDYFGEYEDDSRQRTLEQYVIGK